MPTRLIFICHGQLDREKENGLRLARLIDQTTGFRAFFAEAVHDTDGLSQHIFANLERSDGFLTVMHKRGEVEFMGRQFTRSSVWIQQELAIVAFLNYLRQPARRIRVRVFVQRGINREGLADVLIVNPTEFEQDKELPPLVREWLTGPDFAEDVAAGTRQRLFQTMTAIFTQDHWRFLELMMVLSRGTTEDVDEGQIRRMVESIGGPTQPLNTIEELLVGSGFLLKGYRDGMRGMVPIRLTAGFIDLIGEELRRRGTSWPRGA